MTNDEMMPVIHAYEARRGFTLNTGEMFAFIAGYRTALAAAAREGGDVKQAPGEAPQSGGATSAATPNPSPVSRR